MNCLRNTRCVLSRLLRRKPVVCTPPPPAQAPGYRCRVLRDRPAHRSPQSTHRRNQHTDPQRWEIIRWTSRRGGSQWYEDERVQVAAVLIAGSGAAAVFCSREAVPYTNRTRLILLSHSAERRLGKFLFEKEKRKLGSKILSPLDPESVRVRRIAEEIVRGVHRGLASRHRLDAPDGYGDISADHTIKNRDAEDGGSPHDKNARSAAAAQRDDEAPNQNHGKSWGAQANLDWEVIVVKDKMINAICAPGGKIIVYTGLLDKFREDAEIATVLGHEVGHAIARHIAEQLTKCLWFLILEIVILQFINMPDKIVDVVWKYFLMRPSSRRMEMEADHVGLMLLAAAGYDPRVAPSVYDKLGKIGGDSALRNYISTHPSSKKRSQLLSQEHVMSEALELYWEVSTGHGTEGFPLDSGTQVRYGKEVS